MNAGVKIDFIYIFWERETLISFENYDILNNNLQSKISREIIRYFNNQFYFQFDRFLQQWRENQINWTSGSSQNRLPCERDFLRILVSEFYLEIFNQVSDGNWKYLQ